MNKKIDLSSEKITKLLLMFALPCVISMLINSVYNIVDQIFIGKGVGSLGNAATNVIFPLIILFNAISGLIGNGAAANLSLKLGEGKTKDASKNIGTSITVISVISIILAIISYLLLPKLLYLFGCTENVYPYALEYGKIIILGAPFMIFYSSLSSIIRADGSPTYSMILLVTGAILNIILDPIFIFGLNKGVKGGAIATVIGQIVSFIMTVSYLFKTKNFKLTKKDFIPNKSIFKSMALGLSSFITQCTILVLFVFMNNIMTKLGAKSIYGADIPLSVYGVISKINSLYVSSVIGIAIGSQPIIGFNYGAGNKKRVKEALTKVLTINFLLGLVFNFIFFMFPKQLVSLFISSADENYTLFISFAILMCRTFFSVMALNALEMTTSITLQSLGRVVTSTAVSFTRQIILFIPIATTLGIILDKGINGALYAGPVADTLCFILCVFLFRKELKNLDDTKDIVINEKRESNNKKLNTKENFVITIAREYGSGGRYVGKLLAEKLNINFYDKELITLTSEYSGLSKEYIKENDETKQNNYDMSNDDRIFLAEKKVIEKLAKNESCIIVGRCADYILENRKNVTKVFLYSSEKDKEKRAIKYYGLDKKKALKQINKINKQREKHYKFYTNREWKNTNNYDLMLNVDKLGIDKTVEVITKFIELNNKHN